MQKHRLAMIGVCALSACGFARGASWDFNAQFTWTNNPSGAWTYGTYEGAAFHAFTQNNGSTTTPGWTSPSTAGMWKNLVGPQFGVQTGQVSLHPGEGHQPTAARWTAPRGGRAEIIGTFFAGDAAVLDYAVWHNAVERFHVRSGGDAAFDLARVVEPGDRIDFLVYGGYTSGNTPLDATVTLFISGDADRDGAVNLVDFNRLAANFGQSPRDWAAGDFNDDAVVNLADFNLLAGNFGQSAAGPGVTRGDWAALAAAVPEPGVGVSATMMAAFAALRRCRRAS